MDNEKNQFLAELKHHLQSRGKNLLMYPMFSGKRVDLHELYNKVISYGGYQKVSKDEIWHNFTTDLLQVSSDSASYGLQKIYHKYLETFERVNFFGEDDSRHSATSRYRVFQDRHVNYNASILPWKNSRACAGNSVASDKVLNYDKLVHGLICCLPNEVDFAINNCTLLSGESRHVLRLPSCPQLLDALLLHAGIVSDGVDSLREISEEWKRKTGHDFERFWRDTVEQRHVIEIVFQRGKKVREEAAASSSSDGDESVAVVKRTSGRRRRVQNDETTPTYDRDLLFRPRRAEGVQEYEGQRVLQIAMVLLNLSFEHFNVKLLAKSKSIMNFVFLCLHCNYSALGQTGLDIFSNLSSYVDLHLVDGDMTSHLYDFILKCIASPDKFETVRGFGILANLVRRETNLDLMCVHLHEDVFTNAINSMMIPDVELILSAIECIYRLSQVPTGKICDRIALCYGGIDIIVTLVSLNVRTQFKPESFTKIRLARKVPPTPVPNSTTQKGPMGRPFTHPADPRHISPRPGSTLPPGHHHHRQPPPPNSFQMRAMPGKNPAAFNHPHAMPTQQQQRLQQHHGMPTAPATTSSPYNLPPQRHPQQPPHNVVHPPPTPPRYPMNHPPSTVNRVPAVAAQHPNLPTTTGTVPPAAAATPNSQLQKQRTVALSKPSDAGPMYTHSEMGAAPPIFHYMPAPPSTIALDQKSPEQFSKLWLLHQPPHLAAATDGSTPASGTVPTAAQQIVKGIRRRQTPLPVPGYQLRIGAPGNEPANNTTANSSTSDSEAWRKMNLKRSINQTDENSPNNNNDVTKENTSTTSAQNNHVEEVPAKRLKPDDAAVAKMKSEQEVKTSSPVVEDDKAVNCKIVSDNSSVVKPIAPEMVNGFAAAAAAAVEKNGGDDVHASSKQLKGEPEKALDADKGCAAAANNAVQKLAPSAVGNTTDIARTNDDDDDKKQTVSAAAAPMGNGVSTPPPNDNNQDKSSMLHGCETKLHGNSTATVAPTAKVTLTNGISPHGANHHGTAAGLKEKSETNCSEPMQVDSPAVVQTTTQHQDANHKDSSNCPLVTEETTSAQQQAAQTTNSKLPLSNLSSRVVATAVFSNPSKSVTISCPPHASQKEMVKSPVTPSLPGNPHFVAAATAVAVPPIISVQFPPPPTGSNHHHQQPYHHRVVPQGPPQIPAAIRLPSMSPSKPPPPMVPIHVQKYGVIAPSPQVNVNQYHQRQQQPPPVHVGTSAAAAAGGVAGKSNMQIDLMAPDASVMVLYRNCGKPDFTDYMDQTEDPVSMSIRLTAVLVLINVATKSKLGKSIIRKHRNRIAEFAMSGMDCAPMLARLLWEIRYDEGEDPRDGDDEDEKDDHDACVWG